MIREYTPAEQFGRRKIAKASGKTFRVFVSSTFSDLKVERDALQREVFPKLRDLCSQHGARFQAIDLRWGVGAEAALDQQTMNICLSEIKRCQLVTPRPNFILLLGDRYGWCPLPPQIEATEFEEILTRVSPQDREILLWNEKQPPGHKGWYRRDDNASPPKYCLQSRKLKIPENTGEKERKAEVEREARQWAQIETKLRSILHNAIFALGWSDNDPRRIKYETSATHQEIITGALGANDPARQAFCFLRNIQGLPQEFKVTEYLSMLSEQINKKYPDKINNPVIKTMLNKLQAMPPDITIRDVEGYIRKLLIELPDSSPIEDVLEEALTWLYHSIAFNFQDLAADMSQPHHLLQQNIKQLKIKLREVLPRENVFEYSAQWGKNGVTTNHIKNFCNDVQHSLEAVIKAEIEEAGKQDVINREVNEHLTFKKERVQFFTGRKDMLKIILNYVTVSGQQPLTIYGEGGTGKTALLAEALTELQQNQPDARILYRFIGATPSSSDGRALLESLCQQIARAYGEEDNTPSAFEDLVEEFHRLLALQKDNKSLVLFLDSLDQLTDVHNAQRLTWIPKNLPSNVRLVLSTRPGEQLAILRDMLPESNVIELGPMPQKEGEELLDKWLRHAGRTLQDFQRKKIISLFEVNGNPLYLKMAFEEARSWHSFTKDIELQPDVEGIIGDLYSRLSKEKHHGRIFTSRALGYLAASRFGLSEDELIDILSRDPEVNEDFKKRFPQSPEVNRLPVAVWSRFYFDLKPYLAERVFEGAIVLSFYHRELHDVANRYFLAGDKGLKRHCSLALYFSEQPLYQTEEKKHIFNLRKLAELPFQQARGRLWKDLTATLLDLNFLDSKIRTFGPYPLIEDYLEAERCGCRVPVLSLVKDTLQLSANILHENPGELLGQLHGRLMEEKSPEVKELLRLGRESRSEPWLQPLISNLTRPGGPLFGYLRGHKGVVLSIAISSNGRWALSAASDGTLVIWDLENWEQLRELSLPRKLGDPLPAERFGYREFYFSIGPQETLDPGTVRSLPISLALTPDANLAVFAILGGKALLSWDLKSNVQCHTLQGHTNAVLTLDLTPDGRTVVSGGHDAALLVWNIGKVDNGVVYPSKKLFGHKDSITSVYVTPDGHLVVSGSLDKTVRVWDLHSGKNLYTIHTGMAVTDLVVIDNGRKIVVLGKYGKAEAISWEDWEPWVKNVSSWYKYGNMLKVYWLSQSISFLGGLLHRGHIAKLMNRAEEIIMGLVTLPGISNDKFLALSNRDIKVLKGDTLEHISYLATNLPMKATRKSVVTPDGRFALTIEAQSEHITAWKLSSEMQGEVKPAHHLSCRDAAIDGYGKVAVVGSIDKTLSVWDLDRCVMRQRLTGHKEAVLSVAVDPQGKTAASGSVDQTLRLWDLEKGKCRKILRGHHGPVTNVAMTGDGKYLISGSTDGTVRAWDVKRGKILVTLRPGFKEWINYREENKKSEIIRALALTSDGKRAVAVLGDGSLRKWQLELSSRFQEGRVTPEFQQECRLRQSSSQKHFLQDESNFAHFYLGKVVVRERESRITIGKNLLINSLVVTPDGGIAFGGASDGTLRVWNLEEMRLLNILHIGDKPVWSVAISSGKESYIISVSGQKITLTDFQGKQIIASFTGESDFLTCVISENLCVVAGDKAGRVCVLGLT